MSQVITTFLWLYFFRTIENVEVQSTFKVDVVQRNGKDYLVISDTSLTIDISYFKIDYKYQNVPTAITSMVSGVVNLNWKTLKALIDPTLNRFIGVILQRLIPQLVFDKYSIREIADEFFYVNSTCENFWK